MNQLNFHDEMLKFSKEKFKYHKLKTLAEKGLEVFMSFDGIVSASVFINNEETYEFDLICSIPEAYPFSNVFEYLVESGIIGKVLTTGEILVDGENNWNAQFVIVPLISNAGVLGLCLLDTTVSLSDYSEDTFYKLRLFSSFYASSLSEMILDHKLKEKSELLEQLVAMRTMHLEEKTRDLNEKLSSLTTNLMSSIPHEVRTPINQILGFIKYLKSVLTPKADCEEDEDVSDIINDIEFSAERLKRLFENYLFHTNLVLISMNINEIENLQSKVTHAPDSVIYETVMNMAHNENRSEDIIMDLSDSPVAVYEVFLVKICEELISNSLKFTKPDEKISIKSYIEMNKYVLVFKDFGCGMPAKEVDDIGAYIQFNRDKNEQQGLGLGLSIINRIVNIYHASWDIKSVHNEFTEVILVLPLPDETSENQD